MSILMILDYFSTIGLLFSAFLSVAYIYHIIKSKYERKKYGVDPSFFISVKSRNSAWIYSALFIFSLVSFILINPSFGRIIGYRNLNLEHDGKYTYYAEVFVYDTKESGTVPAQVIKEDGSLYIERIALSNNEFINLFCDDEIYEVKIGKKTDLPIDDGKYEDNYVEVQLINDHAIFTAFTDGGILPIDIILIAIDIISTFFSVYILFICAGSNGGKNAKKLLEICESLIDEYEKELSTPSCKHDLMEIIEQKIAASKDEVVQWKDHNTDYIKIAHTLLAQSTFDLLASGRYHLYHGILNPMSCAENLKKVYNSSMDYGISIGLATPEEKQEQYRYLLECISDIG